MSESSPAPDSRANDRLFRQLAEGRLTKDEFREIENRLATDAAFRADYVRFMDLEAGLYDELSNRSPQAVSAVPAPTEHRPHRWPRAARLSVAALGLAVVIAVGLFWARPFQPQQTTRFLEAQLKGLEEVAVVTHARGLMQNPKDVPLQFGTRLKPGILELRQGELQIDFLSGARVLLRAPAELHVLSSSSATLVSGSAAARVTSGAGKFVLGAPDAAIVDLGTEFAVNVDEHGDSEVHVVEGEVEVSLLGDDGSTLFSQRLTESETVHIDRTSRSMRPTETPSEAFATIRETDRSALHVTPAYVKVVQRSKPLLYWRFESSANGVIPNDAAADTAEKFRGHIITGPEEANAISIADGVAHFSPSDEPRFLKAEHPLAGINRQSYTVELWIKPETFHWGTVVNLIVPGTEGNEMHMGLVEIAQHTHMVHKPCVVRYLHRHPPGRHTWGWNLFSKDVCTPGQWTHIVSVKEPDELRLFINGALVRRVQGSETAGSDADDYVLTIGQFSTAKPDRQFHGMLDELAIYDRAFSEGEVHEHYWTMLTAGQDTDGKGE